MYLYACDDDDQMYSKYGAMLVGAKNKAEYELAEARFIDRVKRDHEE